MFDKTMLPLISCILVYFLTTSMAQDKIEVMICMDNAPCSCKPADDNKTYAMDCTNTDLITIRVTPQNNTMKFSMISFENALLTELLTGEIYQYLHPATVENLNFGKNRIRSIEKHAFDKLTSLKTLILNSNLLTTIDGDWFNGLDQSLIYLDLSSNNIDFIPENAFAQLTTLEYLSLDRNPLKNISDFTFNGLLFLRELSLDYNPLTVVQGKEFAAMSRLETISIEYTSITHLPVFPKSMSSLKKIMLNGNLNENVHAYVFGNVPTVEDITLDKMPKLKTIEKCAFCNLPRLVKLFISDSPNVEQIDENAFDDGFGFTNPVQVLDFSNNSLTSLSSKLIHWRSAGAVYLAGNRWNCTCAIKWMVNGVNITDSPKCFYPETLRNQSIKDVPIVKCYQKTVYATPKLFIAMTIILLIAGAALVLWYVWSSRKEGRLTNPFKSSGSNTAPKPPYAYKNLAMNPDDVEQITALPNGRHPELDEEDDAPYPPFDQQKAAKNSLV